MTLKTLDRYRDLGLLLLRVGIGVSFMIHGAPKLFGGPERWVSTAQFVGIDVLPAFFGFMAGFAEFAGGLLLILGLLFRPAVLLLLIVMISALVAHLRAGDGFTAYSHPIEMGILFLALFIIGPGTYSLDGRFGRSRRRGF